MIYIFITPADYEYDVMSLVQAFYPGEDFKVNKKIDEDSSENRAVSSDFSDKILNVNLLEERVEFEFDIQDKKYHSKAYWENDDRKAKKNTLKKALYLLLSEVTDKKLPWGNLTGIRPAKIPALLLEDGKSENYIREYMKDTYFISDSKLDLSMEIAKGEKSVLDKIPYKEGYSLYVGIPFCPTTCLYCSFTSFPIAMYKGVVDKYIDAMIKEMEYLGPKLRDKVLNSVYIGGGTPTTLEPHQLDRLIDSLKDYFDFSNVVEFTVEAGRPDSITRDKLITLKEHGVNRISINPQTMNQDTLELIGRRHTVKDVIDKFNLARDCGFENINMDIIIGLPNEDVTKLKNTMEEINRLKPDSLTVHSLALKRAARLNIQKEKYQSMKMENNSELMALADDYVRKMGMAPYYLYRQKNMAGNLENVGYSKPGLEGVYNILMMGDKQNIIAIGAGTSTKMMTKDRLSATRIDGIKDVKGYIERIDEMIERKKNYIESNDFYIN